MKLYLIALLFLAASVHGESSKQRNEFRTNLTSTFSISDLQLHQCFSSELNRVVDKCSTTTPVKAADSTSISVAAKCIAKSVNSWNNATNSANTTSLRAALVNRSALTKEKKKEATTSIEECVASDLAFTGPKEKKVHPRSRPSLKATAENDPSVKTLICAIRAFVKSGCAVWRNNSNQHYTPLVAQSFDQGGLKGYWQNPSSTGDTMWDKIKGIFGRIASDLIREWLS